MSGHIEACQFLYEHGGEARVCGFGTVGAGPDYYTGQPASIVAAVALGYIEGFNGVLRLTSMGNAEVELQDMGEYDDFG